MKFLAGFGMPSEFRKASDVINCFFGGFSASDMKTANSFISSWNECVGPRISSHSKVIDVDRGMIIVEVDHPGWSQQLLLDKKRIIKTLATSFPALEITNLSIRVISEGLTPYVRQNVAVGEGLKENVEDVQDIAVRTDIDPKLAAMLEKLKDSIKQGKQNG
jgi:hypothetical protein